MALLRAAFDATVKDPAFVKDAHTMHLAVDEPMDAKELAELVRQVSSTPKSVIERVEGILAKARAAGK
jgi:hypothetical protein